MVDIVLKNGQTGYDAISDYIYRYWNHNILDTVIISIGTSYDGYTYDLRNEIASPISFSKIEFMNDWWEGEKYIKLFGIKTLGELDISGGSNNAKALFSSLSPGEIFMLNETDVCMKIDWESSEWNTWNFRANDLQMTDSNTKVLIPREVNMEVII